jgi:hypothetical protein
MMLRGTIMNWVRGLIRSHYVGLVRSAGVNSGGMAGLAASS